MNQSRQQATPRRKAALKWEGDPDLITAQQNNITFSIEQGSSDKLFWAFMGETPIGIYLSFEEAQDRCESLASEV